MGKKFKQLLAMVLSLTIIATFCAVPMTASAAEKEPLKFGEDGKFKIVIFSDVQDQYPVHQRVIRIMEQAIERENPDLVVFLGDMTEMNTKDVEVDYRRTVEQILGPVVEAGIPYSIVFGNHDNQSYYSGQVTDRAAMLSVWQSIGDCRTTDPAPELTGAGTCKVPIYASDSNDLAFNLWMVDSNSYQNELDGTSGYDNPHADQLAWMAANNDAEVNSLVFQHIPMPENYNLYVEDENGEKTYGDKKYTLALKEGVTGTAGEFPATIYADDNTGEFQTLKEMGNVLGVFTGHDHLNDYSGTYDGIDLTAVPGMTYFNYGDEAIRGYGVIELDENNLSTYDYNTVKFSTLDAEAGGSTETVYDEYDEITYADLKENGNALGSEYTVSGGHTFTYDATSPSKSAILKFRWTAGSKPGYQFSFDVGDSGNISHPFGVWIKRADQVAPNGAWHLKPNREEFLVKMASAIKQGETFDIEFGRKKVLEGDPKIVGQYYVYLKVNGKLIQEGYSNTDENGGYTSGNADCQVSNQIRFGGWGNGGDDVISQYVEIEVEEPEVPVVPEEPETETYDEYDEITYSDLRLDGNALGAEHTLSGGITFTYDATSPSYSAVFKYRFIAGSKAGVQFSFDEGDNGNIANPFGVWIKRTDQVAPNGAWHLKPNDPNLQIAMSEPLVQGKAYDIELGRKLVLTGENKGLYYLYLKVDGELIQETYSSVDENGYYTSGNKTDCQLSNKIRFGCWGNGAEDKMTATPEPETFEEYDEITFDDLFEGNTSMSGKVMDGSHNYTYNATSDSYSMVLKYRWVAGGSEMKFTTFLDDWVYPFCFAAKTPNQSGFGATAGPNGSWHLVPSKDSHIVHMDEPIVAGKAYDVEIARLKVKTGVNAGKYYVYAKVNGELIKDYYYDGVVDGVYSGTALSNKIIISAPAGNKFSAIPVPETFEEYDEITFDDLYLGDESMNGKYKDDGNHTYTYNATSPTYSVKFKYRWTAGSEKPGFTTYLDDWKFPFCFTAKYPNRSDFGAAAGPNGAWHLVPSNGDYIVQMTEPATAGKVYDIEIGRLKVKTGTHAGKYYVYAMVNDELIQSYYYDGVVDGVYDGVALSNKIIIASEAGNKFSGIPIPETFEEYDEIGFDDLYEGSTSMSGLEMEGEHNYTYNATSPTYSVKFKYRWTAGGDEMKFSTYFDAWKYPFCFAVKTPNQTGFGAQAGPNGSWHLVPSNDSMIVDMDEPIVAGQAYDIEIGRLKVKTGVNTGKYYVYFMVDGELVQSYYYNGVVDGVYDGVALSNKIIISAPAGNKFTAVPYVEEYEDFDEIGYEDLIDANGNPLPSNELGVQTSVFTYNKTSASGSAIFKFRWKEANAASNFQICFDKVSNTQMEYMFGIQYYVPDANNPNGKVWLRPGYGPEVALQNAFVTGKDYNIEIARLKVKNGPNVGKYYVYFKINDVLIAESYVDANVVDANGNYVSNPGAANITISNEIFITFWSGGGGNKIAPYKVKDDVVEQEGVRGDFDGDGVINAFDLTFIRNIMLGIEDISELPEGIADFNNDGVTDARDVVALKKYLAPVNSYEKSGSLTLGMQEHLLEDATKTATYIADATATMGATAYRLSEPIHQLFYANSSNEAILREDNMNEFKEMVAALKAKGITEILYVTDSFIIPYGYGDAGKYHNITVPDPVDDVENYTAWLTVNADAFGKLAAEVPEIKFFEPFNEINTTGTRLERYGIDWNATSEQQAAHKFTVKEKAVIMADLCWYISDAVKAVDPANQVTSPSIVVGSNVVIENDFLDEFYKAIESGKYPTGKTLGDKKVDNYFTIVNIHAYPDYTEDDALLWDNFESNARAEVNEWAGYINTAYNTVKAHNDGGSRVWITETGMSTYHSDGEYRDEQNVADIIGIALEKLDNELTYIDTVIFYKIADISASNGASASETNFGLFYSGDDYFGPYDAKPSALTIYSYFHNGADGTSVLEALANRYKA